MKITARKCYFTGKVFTDDVKYLEHLKTLRNQKKKIRELKKQLNSALMTSRDEVKSWKDLEEYVACHLLASVIECLSRKTRSEIGRILKRAGSAANLIPTVSFHNMKWNDHCSNTHASPPGKPQNFHRHHSLPPGYPGWRGSMVIKNFQHYDGFVSSYVPAGVSTHSGGSWGTDAYRYEVTVWAECWDHLVAEREQQVMEKILQKQIVSIP